MAGYPASMQQHAPCRSLAEYRLELIARRLDLTRQQIDAQARLGEIGREIDQITNRLRAIEAARGG